MKNSTRHFPIVGIGASAGGLEAFEELLRHLPVDTGMAFVFVQHLAPGHPSLLVELLTRAATMPIREAQEADRVRPNHVYIIPPNAELTISKGVLHVTKRATTRLAPMPIDRFLCSLARDCGRHSIGIILSGNASDGTVGIKAIKAEGGVTFAQDEKSAKFYGMPGSAMHSGSVDFVLTPRKMAERITTMARAPRATTPQSKSHPVRAAQSEDLQAVFAIIKRATRVDFSLYKRGTILRRMQRRLTLHKMKSLQEYMKLLRGDPKESQAFMEDCLIHVTHFFRDPPVFQHLRKHVLPKILTHKTPRKPCRVWVPGCSTGEEAYSIAMSLVEALGRTGRRTTTLPIKIFATDISDHSLEQARKGIFTHHAVSGVSPARLRRFFVRANDAYTINKEIRDLCVFGKHDVLREPPFPHMDLISCRNLFIYVAPTVQETIVPLLHHALRPHGFLLLGEAETVGPFSHLFQPIGSQSALYVKKSCASHATHGAVTYTSSLGQPDSTVSRPADRRIPPQRISAILQDGQLRKALEATKRTIDVVITRFEETNEALQATNEELNASNEELQSTNEELETAKEELQSTNEELTTLNEELHNRNLEATLAREFADSIVETIREPLLILDAALKVVRANSAFYTAFQLTAQQTEKHHVYSLADGQWDIPRLRMLLETIIPRKKEISNFEIEHDFPAIGYRTLLLNARQIFRQGREAPMILVAMDLLTMENRVTKKIMEYSEGEKLRVGKDLHDGLGQNMTGIALLSRSLERRLAGKGVEEAQEAAKITKLVKQSIFEINRLARGLAPAALENIGLIPALADVAEQVKALFGVQCLFVCTEETITSNTKYKINLYYIAQEAINNAIRHGKATQITVQLKRKKMKRGEEIVLSIGDNGLGLPKRFAKRDGMGLRIMKYRAADIGGNFEMHPRARGGTVITVRCPLTTA